MRPKGASRAVVVLHEIWGMDNHLESACKRLGKLGFAATAPNLYRGYDDLLTPSNVEEAMKAVWELSLDERRDKIKVAETLARKHAGKTVRDVLGMLYDQTFREELLARALSSINDASSEFERTSTLGYSFGGGLALRSAAKTDNLASVVTYCAEPPNGDEVKRISAPVLAIYAGDDDFMNHKVPAFVEAALAGGKDLTLKVYPHAKHDFFNEGRKYAYDHASAAASWSLTTGFLERTLGKH